MPVKTSLDLWLTSNSSLINDRHKQKIMFNKSKSRGPYQENLHTLTQDYSWQTLKLERAQPTIWNLITSLVLTCNGKKKEFNIKSKKKSTISNIKKQETQLAHHCANLLLAIRRPDETFVVCWFKWLRVALSGHWLGPPIIWKEETHPIA